MLLTHDMGGALDDRMVVEGAAGGGRLRTTLLRGRRMRRCFLHDRRTTNVVGPIPLHSGASYPARKRFFELTKPQRDDLIAFLRSP